MPRPPLPLDTYGKIKTWQDSKTWLARAQFRDYDGMVRPAKRTGKTKAAAERALRAALVDRQAPVKQAEITAETKVAELWLADVERAVDAGTKSPGRSTPTARSTSGTSSQRWGPCECGR